MAGGTTTQSTTAQEDSETKTKSTGASRRAVSLLAVSAWSVTEIDGFMFAVRQWDDGEEVLVELQTSDPAAWVCSACGTFRVPRSSAGVLTCEHVGAASRDMPQGLAMQIARLITPAKPRTTSTTTGPVVRGYAANEAALAAALAKSADRRAARVREHDRTHGGLTSEVVVRQATPEDLEHVRLARERKRLRQTQTI